MRNHRNGNNEGDKNKSDEERKKVFEPHFTGKQHMDTCNSVKEQIAMQAQKTFKEQHETVERLREEDATLGEPEAPTLDKASFVDEKGAVKSGKEEIDARLEQDEHNVTFCEALRNHNAEKKQLDDNMQKACMHDDH